MAIVKSLNLAKALLYGLLITGLYHSALSQMIGRWHKPAYNYCYIMPLVVLYLIWQKRANLATLPAVSSWKGIISFIIGLVFFWFGELGGEYFTLYFSFWLVVVGLCWMQLGWQKMKLIAFALFMTLTMFPLPDFFYNKISIKLQLISSQWSATFMQFYGMSVYREGNIIDLGFTQLQVADACSGLHSLISLVVLGILLAYLFKTAFWKRAVLLVSTVPISIITNSLRISLTGILYEVWGARVAEGFFHGFSGWFIFMLSLGVLLVEMWILKKIPPRESVSSLEKRWKEGSSSAHGQKISFRETSEGKLVQSLPSASSPPTTARHERAGEAVLVPNTQKSSLSFFRPPQFITAIFLLSLTLVLSQSIEFREKTPIKKPLDQFPLKIGEWTGRTQSMDQRFIDKLNLSDYVIIEYQNSLGRKVNFYVAYYGSQRKGESIHSPATCLLGSGWNFKQAGKVTIALSSGDGDSMGVSRALMQKGGDRQLVYYWFHQRGRILTNAYQLKIFAFWDSITKHRTDGALVRLITPVYESEEVEEAEARLQAFTVDIVPMLDEYIPGKDLEYALLTSSNPL